MHALLAATVPPSLASSHHALLALSGIFLYVQCTRICTWQYMCATSVHVCVRVCVCICISITSAGTVVGCHNGNELTANMVPKKRRKGKSSSKNIAYTL